MPSGKILTLPAGTYTIGSNFANGFYKDCLTVPTNVGGIWGVGPDSTILQMAPMSSDKAAYVASIADFDTNYCNLIGIYHSNFTLANLQVKGTNQGHYYGGVNVGNGSVDPLVGFVAQDLKFVGASPGNRCFPPEETFSLSLYRCAAPQVVRCEFDGQGITSSQLGANVCTDVYLEDVWLHDQKSGALAIWRCRNVHMVRPKCERMGTGPNDGTGFLGTCLNFEQSDGTILIESPNLSLNRVATGNTGGRHLAFFNDDGTHTNAVNVTVTNVTHDAGPDAGGCFSVYNWTPPTSLTITKAGTTLTPLASGTGNPATQYRTYT